MQETVEIVCPQCSAVNRVSGDRLSDHPKCGKCKEGLFAAHPVQLTEETFERNIWCGPCKMMAPILQQAAARLEPRVRLAKVNTDTEQRLAGQFRIQSIPTLVIFRNGREVARQSGAMDLNNLLRWIQTYS